MTKERDSIPDPGNGLLDGVDLASFTTILQGIFAKGTDYTKMSVENHQALLKKLLAAKSLPDVIQIQTEYARTSYDAFVEQTVKMGELYSDLAKAACRPAQDAIAALQGTPK